MDNNSLETKISKPALPDDEIILRIHPRTAFLAVLLVIAIFSWLQTASLIKITKARAGNYLGFSARDLISGLIKK